MLDSSIKKKSYNLQTLRIHDALEEHRVPIKVIKQALRKWIRDATKDIRNRDAATRYRWSCAELGEWPEQSHRRNLKNGGTLGLVANACGISFDSLNRFLKSNQPKRDETLHRVCAGLIHAKRLVPAIDTVPPQLISYPKHTKRTELLDQLNHLTSQVEGWIGYNGTHLDLVEGRLLLEEDFNQLRNQTLLSEELSDIAHSALIVEAQYIIKASILANHLPRSWAVVAELEQIIKGPGNPGLNAAAKIVQGRLIRELMLSVGDHQDRANWFARSARVMTSITQEYQLPFPIILPGLGVEMNLERKEIIHTSHQSVKTLVTPVPYRYQSAFLFDTAIQKWISGGNNTSELQQMLNRAEFLAQEGLRAKWDRDMPVQRLKTCMVLTKCIRLMIQEGLSTADPTASRYVRSLITDIDQMTDTILPLAKRGNIEAATSLAMYYAIKAYLTHSGDRRRMELQKTLELLSQIHLDRPRMKSITFQESMYQKLFILDRDKQMAVEFLQACGFTRGEMHRYHDQIIAPKSGLSANHVS